MGVEAGFKEEVAFEPGLERGAGMSLALGGKQLKWHPGEGSGKPRLCLLGGPGVVHCRSAPRRDTG